MKKVLLSTAALAGLALVAAAPARAEEPALQLGVGGYISGYAVYTDQDEPTGTDYRSFDFRKDTEVHLSGEVALDNGITAGAHLEILSDRADASAVEESYMYMSSSWGRINFGEEDGIAYLIQVAPPTAEDKVDGPRPDISAFADNMDGVTGDGDGVITYAQDPFGYTNKFTYITPVFNGFQAGFSFVPSVSEGDQAGTAVASTLKNAGDYKNGWELAARYEGTFDELDVALGAGYSKAARESEAAGQDAMKMFNVGATVGYDAFGFGAAYFKTNNGLDSNSDTKGWVLGADYTIGAYKLGLNYVNLKTEDGAVAGTEDVKVDRWTAGAVYEWAPGMTFRGAVQLQEADNVNGSSASTADVDGTQITIGTQLNF